ncbi:MAG TPA: hypothetical protein VH351_04770 [Bryobacteraceae bacterium]|jgi:hypothetical protein|nr:hypothetical protein [Bryobacteraceae bacterium]
MDRRTAIYCFLAGAIVFTSATRAATVDRIEVVVDRQIITELDLEEDIRVTDFLNGTVFDATTQSDALPNQRRAAAERLIDQSLIKQEIALSHYPWVSEPEIDEAVEQLHQARGAAAFEAGLETNQISLALLRRHLALQLTTMRFVAFRFRPELGISDDDLDNYYRRLISKWAAGHPNEPVPTFESSRRNIRRGLVEERTNAALDEWLRDARQRAQIDYADHTLQAVK